MINSFLTDSTSSHASSGLPRLPFQNAPPYLAFPGQRAFELPIRPTRR